MPWPHTMKIAIDKVNIESAEKNQRISNLFGADRQLLSQKLPMHIFFYFVTHLHNPGNVYFSLIMFAMRFALQSITCADVRIKSLY